MGIRTLLKRIEKAEEALKAQSVFSPDCICFPERERPFFCSALEEQVAARVKCPLQSGVLLTHQLLLRTVLKLCPCCFRLRALYLVLGLKPIVQVVPLCPSALLVEFVGALPNLLLNRDQDGRLVRLRCEC
jgi:hypothetical protein